MSAPSPRPAGGGRTAPPLLRPARRRDASAAWRLVRDSGVLDENSPYCYLLAFEELSETCLVAEDEGRVVGFVMALRPPRRPETVFVWQVGVAASERGRGLGRRLLTELVALPGCLDCTHLEATVTPGNEASRALFRSFARRLGAPCEVRPHFAAEDFAQPGHEPEELFRIGPLPAPADRGERP